MFSLKDLLVWWQGCSTLQKFLTLDDIHPSDKQDILPVKNLLCSIPKLCAWSSNLAVDDERKNKCDGLCLYLQHFADLYELFSNNSMPIERKLEICSNLTVFFTDWRSQNGGGKSFISDDLYLQILTTVASFELFFQPKLELGDEENIVCTSILGTNIVENYFSIVRAKILYPNLWEYACVSYHAFVELVKRFSKDQIYSLPSWPLSRKESMKYNDQSGIYFCKDDLIFLCSLNFRNTSCTTRQIPSEEQILYATILATHYKCTRKRLTIRQKTCKQEEGEFLTEIDKADQHIGIFPCVFQNCPKSYIYAGAYRNHLLKVHHLQISGKMSQDLTPYLNELTSSETIPIQDRESHESIECPETPVLILSDALLLNHKSNMANMIPILELSEAGLISDTTPAIIEDEKDSEEQNILRKDEKENEIVVIVFWDLETSGKSFSSNVEYIIEIGCLGWKYNESSPSKIFCKLVWPFRFAGECSITMRASAISGIYSNDVVSSPLWEQVYYEWIEYLSDLRGKRGKMLMLAHNSQSADENCLKCDCDQYGFPIPSYLLFGDTHLLYKKLHESTKKWSLDFLCDKFNIHHEEPICSKSKTTISHQKLHGALEDSKTLYNLVTEMVQRSISFSPNIAMYDQIVKNYM